MMVREIDKYGQTLSKRRQKQHETINICWKYPPREWIKLNCDETYK